ncbi:MAG: hypothetical protein IT210_13170 [Armatimonadetes bacterium]|nr:hypothetical protein [Armatimonadota bacterium]
MGSNEVQREQIAAGQEEDILCWEAHLAPRQPLRAAMAVVVICLMLLLARLLFPSPLFMAASAFMLISSVSEFLFPVRYRLTDRGAHARTLTAHHFIAWGHVRKAYLTSEGIKLSPFAHPSRLEGFRGVFLRFGEDAKKVIEIVRRCREVSVSDRGTQGQV